MTARSSAKPLYVTIMAANPTTMEGLHEYLSRAGITSHATRALLDASMVPPAASVVVIFPDEFGVDDVVTSMLRFRVGRPRLLIVVVTSTPQRFQSALAAQGDSLLPVVLPKPAFSWIILDAIRAHALSEPS